MNPDYFSNEMRRTDLAWNDWQAVDSFLKDQVICRIAVHDDPFPYVVAQSYTFVGDMFLLHCSSFGRLRSLIDKNPNVSIEIDRVVSLLKAPNGQNTSVEYYSVLARCSVELRDDPLKVKSHQYRALKKFRPENDYIPIGDFAPTQIVALNCRIIELSAKKRILSDGQYVPPGLPHAAYERYEFPPPAALSSLPDEAFSPLRWSRNAALSAEPTSSTAGVIERKQLNTGASSAVTHAGVVYLSGELPDSSNAAVEKQIGEVLAKIDLALLENGSDRHRVLSATVWLFDLADLQTFNSIWDNWIPQDAKPVTAIVQSALIDSRYKAQIQITAAQRA